jgi:hypothetical protein
MYGDDMFKSLMIALVVGGVAIGFVLFVIVPWLWTFIRPWLHFITA